MGSSDMHESGNFSAFIAGALLGAGVALLLAPQSGSQMRGLLRDYASRAKEELPAEERVTETSVPEKDVDALVAAERDRSNKSRPANKTAWARHTESIRMRLC